MQVNLKRNWFAPGGARYRSVNNPNEIPDDLRGKLPSDAEILEDGKKVLANPSKAKAIAESDRPLNLAPKSETSMVERPAPQVDKPKK